MTDQPEQIARIDTIHTLLNSKIKNLKELIRAKKSQNPEDYYNQAIALIESNRDTSPDIPQIQKRVITTRDSSYIKSTKKKKGFLGIFSSRQPDFLFTNYGYKPRSMGYTLSANPCNKR